MNKWIQWMDEWLNGRMTTTTATTIFSCDGGDSLCAVVLAGRSSTSPMHRLRSSSHPCSSSATYFRQYLSGTHCPKYPHHPGGILNHTGDNDDNDGGDVDDDDDDDDGDGGDVDDDEHDLQS